MISSTLAIYAEQRHKPYAEELWDLYVLCRAEGEEETALCVLGAVLGLGYRRRWRRWLRRARGAGGALGLRTMGLAEWLPDQPIEFGVDRNA